MGTKIVTRTREQAYNHWLKALESGKYKQAKGALKKGKGFCCLGVACDLASKDGGPMWKDRSFMNSTSSLPRPVHNFLGMSYKEHDELTVLNDEKGYDFRMIAQYIRENIMPKALARPANYRAR